MKIRRFMFSKVEAFMDRRKQKELSNNVSERASSTLTYNSKLYTHGSISFEPTREMWKALSITELLPSFPKLAVGRL